MPYCEAGDIGKVISTHRKSNQSIPEAQVLRWMTQVALGLEHVHAARVVHRDLKPVNVLLAEGGAQAKIADFGLAIQLTEDANEMCTEATEVRDHDFKHHDDNDDDLVRSFIY